MAYLFINVHPNKRHDFPKCELNSHRNKPHHSRSTCTACPLTLSSKLQLFFVLKQTCFTMNMGPVSTFPTVCMYFFLDKTMSFSKLLGTVLCDRSIKNNVMVQLYISKFQNGGN